MTYLRRALLSKRKSFKSEFPVICVGNLQSGGAGKTPVVIEIAKRFQARAPIILTRGYKSRSENRTLQLDRCAPDGIKEFGDEPWLMSKRTDVPIIVGKDRAASARLAQQRKLGRLLILDDGFQSFRIHQDVKLVVFGDGDASPFCLPLGELREGLAALRVATAVVITQREEQETSWECAIRSSNPSARIFHALRKFENLELDKSAGVGAFAGIASPSRFLRDLTTFTDVVHFESFSDHHSYSEKDLEKMVARGTSLGASTWVTTEKDWPKVEAFFLERSLSLHCFRIRYEFSEDFWYFIEEQLGKL